MSGEPYLSSEDSALLRTVVTRFSGEMCLEIGAGNGGNLILASKRFGTVVGTDVVRPTMSDWKGVANFLLTEGASCIRPESFDLVEFNPPYLKAEGGEDRTVEGGVHLEVPKKFLQEALRVVRKEGRIVFLLNNEADIAEFGMLCAHRGFRLRRVESLRVFFEELIVYEAVPMGP
jgi:tRNA1(Val) A37 N6-methylase TrmN6